MVVAIGAVAASGDRAFGQGGTWTTVAPMPQSRANFGAATVGGTVYAIGGRDAANLSTKTVQAYDTTTDTWTQKAPMGSARQYFAVAIVNGIIYAMGGADDSGSLTSVEAYDPTTDTWTPKQNMPTVRANFGAAAVNGIVYAVGGGTPIRSNTIVAYDPTTDTWNGNLAPMSTARTYHSVAALDGLVYVIGGGDGIAYLSSVEAYDPLSNTWTTVAPLPSARFGTAAGVAGGALLVTGGVAGAYLTDLLAYDPLANAWSPRASLNTPRVHHAAAAFAAVTAAGNTTATQSSTGPTPPSGFQADGLYINLETTAAYTGTILVALTYDPTGNTPGEPALTPGQEATLQLLHYESGQWVDVTTSVDTVNHVIHGSVSALSPFLIVIDRMPPVITCPSNITVQAMGGAKAMPVSFLVTATDKFGPKPTIVSSPPSGSLFPIGVTTVNSTATDAAGNTATCSFLVIVQNPLDLAINKAQVHFHKDAHGLDEIEIHGSMSLNGGYLPADIRKSASVAFGHATISLAGQVINSTDLTLTVKDADSERWEYKGADNAPGIKQLKLDWKDVPTFDSAKGGGQAGLPRIVSRFIGHDETNLRIFYKGAALPFTVNFGNLAAVQFNADETVTTSLVHDLHADDSRLDVTLPFRLDPTMTITFSGSVNGTVNVVEDVNYFSEGGKYEVKALFNPTTFGLSASSTPRELSLYMRLGSSPYTEGTASVEPASWTKIESNHWHFHEDDE